MTSDTLVKRYPWYRKHFRAVNTLAKFLSIDVAQVLRRMDSRMRTSGMAPRRGKMVKKAA